MSRQEPDTPTTSFRRSKEGCQTCRRRKKKCDEVRPTCGGCTRNNIPCQWPVETSQTQRRRRRYQSERLWPSGLNVPQGLNGLVTVFAIPSRQMLYRMMTHFTQFSPVWLCISPGQRRHKYLRQVMPLALGNPLTLNCILAASAADLAKYAIKEPELRMMAFELYGKAIAELNAAVSKELESGNSVQERTLVSGGKHHLTSCLMELEAYNSVDNILLAVLLLCVHEVQ